MARKSTKPKKTRVRLRRNSYYKKLDQFIEEWCKKEYPDLEPFKWPSAKVYNFLNAEYKMEFRSTSMRKIKGEKINKPGSWSVRVDYYDSHDPKLFTLFCLKFAPTIIDKTWFQKKGQGF